MKTIEELTDEHIWHGQHEVKDKEILLQYMDNAIIYLHHVQENMSYHDVFAEEKTHLNYLIGGLFSTRDMIKKQYDSQKKPVDTICSVCKKHTTKHPDDKRNICAKCAYDDYFNGGKK